MMDEIGRQLFACSQELTYTVGEENRAKIFDVFLPKLIEKIYQLEARIKQLEGPETNRG